MTFIQKILSLFVEPNPEAYDTCGMCGDRPKCCFMCNQCIGDGGLNHRDWCRNHPENRR